MFLEAVWLKNGKEVAWVDPVLDLICDDNITDIASIEVYNGYGWYTCKDFNETPDNFIIRIKKEN